MKYVGLQDDVFCRKPKKNGVLTLVAGAQRIDVPFGNLYHAKKTGDNKKMYLQRS